MWTVVVLYILSFSVNNLFCIYTGGAKTKLKRETAIRLIAPITKIKKIKKKKNFTITSYLEERKNNILMVVNSYIRVSRFFFHLFYLLLGKSSWNLLI